MNIKRNIPVALFLLFIILTQLASCAGASTRGLLTEVSSFENGARYENGGVTLVELRGTWREMGRQYGSLLKAELEDVLAFINEIYASSDDNKAKIESTVATQKNQCPYTIREFFAGASQTSSLSEDELQLVNAVERIAGLPRCSAAFAWGDYAKDKLVIGRNYDYAKDFEALSDDVAVTVYHPADGALATATVGYVGEIYAVNAVNEKGIFMELNNGKPSANIKSPDARITGTTLLFEMMFEADSLSYADLFFNSSACSSSYIINMADSVSARSYEWCPTGVKHGESENPDGLLVSANHYLNPEWDFETPTDDASWNSLTRRANLINLCGQSKGKIDETEMMRIINTDISSGGAKNELTVYQLVVVPETLTLYLRIENSADWTQIDLKAFM